MTHMPLGTRRERIRQNSVWIGAAIFAGLAMAYWLKQLAVGEPLGANPMLFIVLMSFTGYGLGLTIGWVISHCIPERLTTHHA